jgi:hypothetical protein
MKLTPELVKDCWKFFETRHGTRHVNKYDLSMALLVKWMGIKSLSRFFDKYAFILGRKIYVPFEVGSEDNRSLVSQVMICCHEHQHRIQAVKAGQKKFAVNYVTSSAKRAKYEIDAYSVSMEVYYLLTGRMLLIKPIIDSLRDSYLLSENDLLHVRSSLSFTARLIEKGGVIRQASKDLIDWMKEYGG